MTWDNVKIDQAVILGALAQIDLELQTLQVMRASMNGNQMRRLSNMAKTIRALEEWPNDDF